MMPHMIPPMSVFLLLHGTAFQSREHAALWRSGVQILYAEASEAFAEPWAAENDTSRQTAKPQPKYITIQENASKNERTRGGGELVHSGPLIFFMALMDVHFTFARISSTKVSGRVAFTASLVYSK